MSTLLTYISVKDGKIKRSSLEVLSRCVELAGEHGHDAAAIVIDQSSNWSKAFSLLFRSKSAVIIELYTNRLCLDQMAI